MKKILIILACLLGMEANAQQKQLSDAELKNAQTQIRMTIGNLASYIERLGNSEMAGGASRHEKAKLLKFVKRSFYEFSYRYVSVSRQSGLKRLKADTYFYNLAFQGSKNDGKLRVYKIDADELYLSKKVLNPKNYKLVNAQGGVRRYKITIPVQQVYLITNSQYSPERTNDNTVIEKDTKNVDLFVLVDDEGDVLCKLGNVNIKLNK